jgi:hypothetical protein
LLQQASDASKVGVGKQLRQQSGQQGLLRLPHDALQRAGNDFIEQAHESLPDWSEVAAASLPRPASAVNLKFLSFRGDCSLEFQIQNPH